MVLSLIRTASYSVERFRGRTFICYSALICIAASKGFRPARLFGLTRNFASSILFSYSNLFFYLAILSTLRFLAIWGTLWWYQAHGCSLIESGPGLILQGIYLTTKLRVIARWKIDAHRSSDRSLF